MGGGVDSRPFGMSGPGGCFSKLLLLLLFVLTTATLTLTALFYDGSGYELHEAAADDDVDRVRELLRNGADADSTVRDFLLLRKGDPIVDCSALLCASSEASVDMVRLLLDNGASVDQIGDRWYTPLHKAAMNSDPDVARLLLERGADVSARGFEDRTALEVAASRGSVETARVILDATMSLPDGSSIARRAAAKARSTAEFNHYSRVHTLARMFTVWADEVDGVLVEPELARAARTSPALVESLLARDEDPSGTDPEGWTPLMWAVGVLGHTSSVEQLLRAGADPHAVSREGWTALLAAAESGVTERVEALLDTGADPNQVEFLCGRTALHYAATRGDVDMVKVLVESGANPRIQNLSGTAAGEAARFRRTEEGVAIDAYFADYFVNNPLSADDIVLVFEEPVLLRLREHLRPRIHEWSVAGQTIHVRLRMPLYNLPIDVAFDAFLVIDGEEQAVGSIVAKRGAVTSKDLLFALPKGGPTRADLVLRPNPELAASYLRSGRIWGRELRLESTRVLPEIEE